MGLNTFSFIFSLIYGMLLNTFAMDWFSLIIALSLGQLHFNHQLIKNSRMHPALIHQIFGKKFNSRTLINKIDTYGILFLSLILIEFYRSLLVWIPLSFVYLSYFKILKYGKEREKEKEQEKRKNEKEEKEKEEGKRPKKKGDRVKKKQGNYPQNTQVHNKEEIERNIEKWYVRAMIGLFVVLIMFAL